jgi:cation transporter-like permease
MSSAGSRPHQDLYRTLMGIVRVIVVTFLATLLAFSIGLFFGIVGVVLTKMIWGNPNMDMSLAYRHVALPLAVAALLITFAVALVSEIRHFRRGRTRSRPAISGPRAA